MKRTFYYALFIVSAVGVMWFCLWREADSGTLQKVEFDVAKRINNPYPTR